MGLSIFAFKAYIDTKKALHYYNIVYRKTSIRERFYSLSVKEITEPPGNCGACLPTNKEINGTEVGEQTIAEHKQAQEAHTLEPFYAMTNMFAALDVIYFTMELKYDESGKPVDGIFLEVNAATERLLGKSRGQLIGKSRKELFGNFFDELPEKFDKVVKTGKPLHFEGYGGALKKCYDIYAWVVAENQVSVILRDITESKKAEEALEENENRLQNIMDAMDDGLVLIGLDSKVIDCNNASLRQLGLTRAELIGNNITDFIVPEEKQDSIMECKLQIQKTGKVVTQVKAFRKDMSTFPAEVSITALYDRSKKPIVLLGVARDITERKKAEDALRKSEARLRLIAQAGRIGFFEYNASKDIAYWSPEHYDLLGYKSGSVISWQRWLQGVHPDDKARVMDNAAKLLERGRSEGQVQGHKDEYRFIRPDGCIVWIESDLSLTMVNNEAIIRGSIRDITERKKAEDALQESERLYRTIFDNSQDGFQLNKLIYDENGKPVDCLFLKVNSAYELQSGIKAKDIVGKTAKQLTSNTEQFWFDLFAEVAKTGKTRHVENYNEPTRRWYDFYVFPYSEDTVGSLLRDITERKRMEKQLQDSERLAAIGATAGMVGHDIRNPLQAIVSDLFLARQEADDMSQGKSKEGMLESISSIEHNVFYINKIVQDLQDYARSLNPTVKETDLKSVTENTLSQHTIPQNIDVVVNIDSRAQTITVDPDFLKRILDNLVLNAIQAMHNGGKLTIRANKEPSSGDVILTVKDTGVGISDIVKDKLFTPMFTTKSKGQGFGLAVVKRMTEALGGTVTFESETGKGTTFIVRLPPKDKR